MDRVKVSVVGYLNSQPFIYGLEKKLADHMLLSKDVPSECARKVINKEVDLGLVPVASLPLIENGYIFSDYCLAADGPVNSVFLFSNKPLEEIRTICLDEQSMTSNNLVKVLCKHYWKLNVSYTSSEETDAWVRIGDKTFDSSLTYPFIYDLSGEWKKYTGLPFVFAVWAANKPLSNEFGNLFNAALQKGLDEREEVLKLVSNVEGFDVRDYLYHKMIYHFNEENRKAMNLFLELIKELS